MSKITLKRILFAVGIIGLLSITLAAALAIAGSHELSVHNSTDKILTITINGYRVAKVAPGIEIITSYKGDGEKYLIDISDDRGERFYSRTYTGSELFTMDSKVIMLSDTRKWFGKTLQIVIMPVVVTNALGATEIGRTSAILNGNLINDKGIDTAVHIYWGSVPGGKEAASWANDENLGIRGTGAFSKGITGLVPGTLYYYICYASNQFGSGWADGITSFFAR